MIPSGQFNVWRQLVQNANASAMLHEFTHDTLAVVFNICKEF